MKPPTLAQTDAWKPFAELVLAEVDKRLASRLQAVGIYESTLHGDHLRGPINRHALLFHTQATPEPVPVGDVKWGQTTYPCRARSWRVHTQEAGNISFSVEYRSMTAAVGDAWTLLTVAGEPTSGGSTEGCSATLTGWRTDGRGWTVIPANVDWRVTVTGNDAVMNACLLLGLERLPEDLFESTATTVDVVEE